MRIAGIDAPEKKQAFGQRSKQAMSDCAFGKDVEIEWKKLDRYGRTIGKVVGDGVDCGLRQIELGMAWHYKCVCKGSGSRRPRSVWLGRRPGQSGTPGTMERPRPRAALGIPTPQRRRSSTSRFA